jgi:hypothetical protein
VDLQIGNINCCLLWTSKKSRKKFKWYDPSITLEWKIFVSDLIVLNMWKCVSPFSTSKLNFNLCSKDSHPYTDNEYMDFQEGRSLRRLVPPGLPRSHEWMASWISTRSHLICWSLSLVLDLSQHLPPCHISIGTWLAVHAALLISSTNFWVMDGTV